MKKNKILLMILIIGFGFFFITGCNNKQTENQTEKEESKNVAKTLSKVFESEIKKEKEHT